MTKAATLTHQMTQLIRRVREHALAFTGSAGQGAFLLRHCIKPDRAIIRPANKNTQILFFPSHVICGTVSIMPAITAPAPILTSKAGRAQQISVPVDVNREKKAGKVEGAFIFS